MKKVQFHFMRDIITIPQISCKKEKSMLWYSDEDFADFFTDMKNEVKNKFLKRLREKQSHKQIGNETK